MSTSHMVKIVYISHLAVELSFGFELYSNKNSKMI